MKRVRSLFPKATRIPLRGRVGLLLGGIALTEEPEVVLAEVSIYLRVEFTESQYERLGHLTDEAAREAAARYFSVPVRVEVGLGEGSVFGKVRVFGLVSTLAIGHTLATLGDIGGSVELAKNMYEGAKAFGEVVTHHFISDAGASQEQVESAQVRANAPKQIVRVLERIEQLENNISNMSPKEVQAELHKARKQLERALPRVPPHEKLQVLNQLRFKNLPPFSQWPTHPPDEPLPTALVPKFELSVENLELSAYLKREAPRERKRIGATRCEPKLRYGNTFFVKPTT